MTTSRAADDPAADELVEKLEAHCRRRGHHVTPLGEVDAHACAELVDRSLQTLSNWRVVGAGPVFIRRNRCVLYRLDDIASWLLTFDEPPAGLL